MATKKEDLLKSAYKLERGNEQIGGVPFSVGDRLDFDGTIKDFVTKSENLINGVTTKWDAIQLADGSTIGISHIIRQRNGLPLGNGTRQNRFDAFLNLFNDDAKLTLEIDKVVEKTFLDQNGKTSKSTFYKFKVV